MYETRVKSNGTKLKLKVWNSNKGKILEEKVHNLKKVCKTTKGNNSNIVSYFLVSRNKSKHVFRIFRFFQFYKKKSKHLFSYFYILPFSETTWKYFFVCLYFISFAKWPKLGETMPCFGQFRVTRKKYETVSPNINDHTNLAIVKVWSRNVSIRVNRTRWIRTSLKNHSFNIFANFLWPCRHQHILSSIRNGCKET